MLGSLSKRLLNAFFRRSTFSGSGDTKKSRSCVARTSPCAAMAMAPMRTYRTSSRSKAARIRLVSSKSIPGGASSINGTIDHRWQRGGLPAGHLLLPNSGTILPNMGRDLAHGTRLADALFSPVQQRVLALLFGNPERTFRSSELISLADSGTGAVHRQLMRLA